jgi:hypothetical protein
MGKAYYRFKTSIAMNMIDVGNGDSQSYIDREVNNIHGQLPPKTKLISVKKNIGEMTLAYSCVAIFEHPIFIDDSEIKDLTNYTRDFGINTGINSEQQKCFTFNKSDHLNFDDFINKKEPKEEPEYEIHVDGVKEIRK